jgi:hypothetical protein
VNLYRGGEGRGHAPVTFRIPDTLNDCSREAGPARSPQRRSTGTGIERHFLERRHAAQ